MIIWKCGEILNNDIIYAFSLTLLAGLATGIGSLLSLFAKKKNTSFLAICLGFSAGVMIYVSFVEIFVKANDSLNLAVGGSLAPWLTVLGFFLGMFFIGFIDKLLSSKNNNEKSLENKSDKNLLRMGMFTALAIGIHNFPEGLATFMAALEDPSLGVAIAIAIAIHNIPEGIAVSVPIYYATGSKKKALKYSFLSGVAEPVGALLGYFLLLQFMSDAVFGIVFASVAGIMVYISLNDLLPSSRKYGSQKIVTYGMILGMIVMALSLLII